MVHKCNLAFRKKPVVAVQLLLCTVDKINLLDYKHSDESLDECRFAAYV